MTPKLLPLPYPYRWAFDDLPQDPIAIRSATRLRCEGCELIEDFTVDGTLDSDDFDMGTDDLG